MLRRKYSVQKSFRIDAKLSEDLETLSEVLNRPQNDLINTALEELMIQNKKWFIEDYFVYEFRAFFSLLIPHKYTNGDLTIEIEVSEDLSEAKCLIISNKYSENDEFVVKTDEKGMEEIKKQLRSLKCYLSEDSKEMAEYLKRRLDYK